MKVLTQNPIWIQLLTALPHFFPIAAPTITRSMDRCSDHTVEEIGPYSLVQFAHQGNLVHQGIPAQDALVKAHQTGTINAIDLIKGAVKARLVPATAMTDCTYLHAVETSFLLHYWFHNSEP